MKKALFTLIFLVSMVFIVNPVYAADTIKQVDIGSFDVWKNSSGAWIPSDPPRYTQAYKPGDTVKVTYTVTAPANKVDQIQELKSVSFVTPDNSEMAFKDAISAITRIEFTDNYHPYQVNQTSNFTHNYTGNGRVEISVDVVLTGWVEVDGKSVKKIWQGQNVDGRQFYIPTVIEWELKEGAPDYWITSPNGTSFTGEPGSTITIPAEVWNSGNKTDTTDFISWWDGDSWENNIGYYDNLTLGYGEKADTPVTVTVPEAPKTLWFRVNCDNNTPVGESDLTNNTLAVTVGPDGVDLGLFLIPSPDRAEIPWSMDTYPAKVHAIVARYDQGTEPIDAVLTLYTPFGTRTTNVTGIKSGEELEYILDFPISVAGTYVYNGIVEPSGGHVDIYLPDNQNSCTMVITRMPAPVMPKIEVESELKGQLSG